jgi:hypothetical protein
VAWALFQSSNLRERFVAINIFMRTSVKRTVAVTKKTDEQIHPRFTKIRPYLPPFTHFLDNAPRMARHPAIGEAMAEFGKRNVAGGARVHNRPEAAPADLAAAIAVVKTGQLPYWAKTGPLPLVIVLVAAIGLFWWLILPYGGVVLRDYRLAGTWQPAYDIKVVAPKCTRYNLTLTICGATLTSLAEPDQAPVAVDYMMAFESGGGVRLVPVRSTLDPSALTIAYLAETLLTNRLLTFLVIAFGFAMIVLATGASLLRGRYVGGAAHRALLAGFAELQAQADRAAAAPRAPV